MAHHHGGAGGGLSGTFRGLGTILALIGTVFVAPRIWPLVEVDIWRWLIDLYSPGVAHWLHFAGWVATYPLTFCALRAAFSAAFAALALFIASRMR